MEDLQLSLTSSRVDQKNFGLLLQSWQVGKILSALVTDKAPSGELVLRVAGQQITATVDIPVQKGSTLLLEVASLQPIPVLKVIRPVSLAEEKSSAISQQIQTLLARQGSVIEPMMSLFGEGKGANLLTFLGVNPSLLKQIGRKTLLVNDFPSPSGLKKALRDSGFFFESDLKQHLEFGKPGSFNDLKANYLQLLEQVKQLLGKATVNSAESLKLASIQSDLEGAIARISLNQLGGCQVTEQGSLVLAFEIPYTVREHFGCLSMLVERQGAQSGDDQAAQTWKVSLSGDFPPLGVVSTDLYITGDSVSAVVYSEQASTAQLMEHSLEKLVRGLQSQGLEVGLIRSEYGPKPAQTVPVFNTSSGLDAQA